MKINGITLVVAVDDVHAKELQLSLPTWVKHKAEISTIECVVLIEPVTQTDVSFINEHLDNVSYHYLRERNGNESQREYMLSSFIHVAPKVVNTDWWLKIDTDVVATFPCRWFELDWFSGNAFVASPWKYTKPAGMLDQCDTFFSGDIRRGGNKPEREISKDGKKAFSSRIISWLMFVNTNFSRELTNRCGGKMPCPSQDTLSWYYAEMLGWEYLKVRFSKLGWSHVSPKKLPELNRIYS